MDKIYTRDGRIPPPVEVIRATVEAAAAIFPATLPADLRHDKMATYVAVTLGGHVSLADAQGWVADFLNKSENQKPENPTG